MVVFIRFEFSVVGCLLQNIIGQQQEPGNVVDFQLQRQRGISAESVTGRGCKLN